jgi:transcriptional regulator with XRE-family HTH domain
MAVSLSQELAAHRIGKSRRWWLDLEMDRISPRQSELEAIAEVLGTSVEALTSGTVRTLRPVQVPDSQPLLVGLDLPTGQPADYGYVEAIHDTIRHLVALEVRHGGDDVAPLAQRAFESARRRPAAGGHNRSLDRDLTAAVGELAEVAAWLLHDADDQEGARRLNIEALLLSRLSGDRSIELLTDGTTREDPEWAWWVDSSEVTGHLAWAYVEAGEPAKAAPILQRSVEACPPAHANNHLFRLARFLGATVDARAWPDAEEVVGRLLPFAAEVRLGRAVRLLRGAIGRIDDGGAPARLAEAGRRLEATISAGQA